MNGGNDLDPTAALANTSDSDAERFAAIAARLASDHPGEAAAAAHLGTKVLAARGQDWTSVVLRGLRVPRPPTLPKPLPPRRRAPSTETVVARLRWLIGGGWSYLSPHEQVWCIARHDEGGPYSAETIERINRIVRRVEAEAGARCGEEVPL
jgi:hypothetical protein